MRISSKLAAVAAFFVIGAAVAGCGSSVPGNSVASVAGNPISLSAFNHWMYVAAKEQASQYASEGLSEPPIVSSNPTNFSSCVKAVRAGIPSLRTTSEATLASDCKKLFTQYSGEVLNFLIQGYWLQADAHRAGISTASVESKFNKALKKQFTTKAALTSYLSTSGQTKQDMLFQYRVTSVYQKLVKRIEKKVTSAQIAAYYNSHKSAFGTAETRDIHLVRTKTRANAQAAYNALKGGASWTTVAKQYSIDAAAKKNGGVLTGVTSSEEESAVSKVIFASPVNKLVGPVTGVFGSYVLEVTKITPATQESLAKATKSIKTQLSSTALSAAETKVVDTAQKHWKSKTTCRDKYQTSNCSNYKAPKTTTTATTTPTTASTTASTSTTSSTASTSSTSSSKTSTKG